jgi:hypothetical protein
MGIPDLCIVNPCDEHETLCCAICSELVLEPVQTCTNHVFCRPCISEALRVSATCPMTREPLEMSQVFPLEMANPVLFRLWSRIKAKCTNTGCHWVGETSDFLSHRNNCTATSVEKLREELVNALHLLQKERQTSSELRDHLEQEKRKNVQLLSSGAAIQEALQVRQSLQAEKNVTSELRAQITREQWKIAQLSSQNEAHQREVVRARERLEKEEEVSTRLRTEINQLISENSRLSSQLQKMKSSVEHLQDKLDDRQFRLDSTYSYNSQDVVELTGYIFMNRHEVPAGANSNRIFNCISKIYQAWKRKDPNNPRRMYWKTQMLLAVSLASKWFTDRQFDILSDMQKYMIDC